MALEPYEEALGCSTHVYYDRTELNGAIAGGQVDIVAMPLALAYSSSMYLAPYFKSYVLRPFYAPYSILMSMSDWEAMNSELQDIITK